MERIPAPRPLLRFLRRRHSKKQRGSKKRKRSALRLAWLHEHIRQDFLHKVTTHLANPRG